MSACIEVDTAMIMNVLLAICLLIVAYCVFQNLARKEIVLNGQSLLARESTDTLRGFAIIMIAFAHICQYENNLRDIFIGGGVTYRFILSWGAIGVSLFFLLSGYGCYLSIKKNENNIGKWLARHISKMLVHFVFAFAIVITIVLVVFRSNIKIEEILLNFITLRLPGSTVWYFKIQIIFYLILAISMLISKGRAWILVVVLSLGYAFAAKYALGLADYWWKTSLCFPFGCIIAHYRHGLSKYSDKLYVRLLLILFGCFSYLLLVKDRQYRLYVQLPAYVIIAFTIMMVWGWLVKENRIFSTVGKISLDLYLIHIGIVEGVLLMNIDINLKIMLFLIFSAVLTIACYFSSEKVYGIILHLRQSRTQKNID